MAVDWQEIFTLFETDDGSLPDIELTNLSGAEVIYGYEFLRDHSKSFETLNPYYWSNTQEKEIPIKFADNPAIQVVSGEGQVFHLCFNGIESPTGKAIPVLGIFVFPDCLDLDYRMGYGWSIEAVQGLFELLYAMNQGFQNMELFHKINYNDEDGIIFQSAWLEYIGKL